MRRSLLTLFIGVSFIWSACQKHSLPGKSAAVSVDSLFRAYYDFKKQINPIEATKAGYYDYDNQVANYVSKPYQQGLIRSYRQFLSEISTYDSTQLTEAQWLSLGVMKWDCEIKLEGLTDSLVTIASPMYDMPNFQQMPLIQIQSLHLYFSTMAGGDGMHPFRTLRDYEDWLQRVEAFIPFLDTARTRMEEGIAGGIVLPKVLIERMIPQLDDFVNKPVQEHLFYGPVKRMPQEFSNEDRDRLTKAFADMVGHKVIPAYRKLQDFLRTRYLPAGRATHGISALPGGKQAFQHLIRYFTTTNMTPDEIHALGLQEVARIRGEMEQVRKQTGFKGDLRAFFDHVRSNRVLMPFNDPAQVIANFYKIRDRINLRIDSLFELKPKGGFEVRRTEAFREKSASAEFLPGTRDGSRPGIFYVPIRDVLNYNTYADESLFLHEAVPGHYFQLTLQQENDDLPEFLHPESISVFVEGWALYAESLGKELGLYDDPYQYFGMLSMEMHRAIRLVLETGIHAKGWTREQAIRYSMDNEAESLDKITVEVERYIATPGGALCYKVGQLKIRELRTRAERALGSKFNIREFHSQILNSGSLPLLLLEKKINRWIASKR
ncbi:MAG: DUF885 domain-containing protein [Cyclobacteriaceae bacterium]